MAFLDLYSVILGAKGPTQDLWSMGEVDVEPALHDDTVPGVNRRHSIMLSPIASRCFFKPMFANVRTGKKNLLDEFSRPTVTFRRFLPRLCSCSVR